MGTVQNLYNICRWGSGSEYHSSAYVICSTGVWEKNTPFMGAFALQSRSGNCSPPPELVLWYLVFPHVFISGGVFVHSYTILQYDTILYYTVRYYTVLYYTILYYTILYYTILYYPVIVWFGQGLRSSPSPLTSRPQGLIHVAFCTFWWLSRHRLNGYLAQRVPCIFLASSFRMYFCEVLKGMFPWRTRYPLS